MADLTTHSDSLNRANGAVGAAYINLIGTMQVVGNRARQNALGSTPDLVCLASTLSAADQWVSTLVPTYANTSQYVKLLLRYNAGTGNGYEMSFDGDFCSFLRHDAYVSTFINGDGCVITPGDTLKARVVGNQFQVLRNGVVLPLLTFTETTYASGGTAGWGLRAVTSLANCELDDFAAGIVVPDSSAAVLAQENATNVLLRM